MKTYEYVDKNGSAVVTLTAGSDKEAQDYLNNLQHCSFRLNDSWEE